MKGSITLILSAAALLLAAPASAPAWGNLKDVRYKIKGEDGNRWAHLLGRGKIVRGNELDGKISFTFDDGPDHRTTPIILDELDRFGVKAAFFVNGHRFHTRTAGGVENQAVLREVYRRGHFIGNHTFTHKDITTLDDEGWRLEVLQVDQLVRMITGRRTWIFRPPFGAANTETLGRLSAEGYTVVMWNLDPLDWKADNALELLERTKKVVEENPDGGVILLHDTNRKTAEALPLIFEWLQERNTRLTALGQPTLDIVGIDHFIHHKRKNR